MADFSLICWTNDMKKFDAFVRGSFMNHEGTNLQWGEHNVEGIVVGQQSDGKKLKNMGQAYNEGLKLATHKYKIYMHQDCGIIDRSLLNKLDVFLSRPWLGVVGILGSTVDTGASYFQAAAQYQSGASHDLEGFRPEGQRVKILDGLFMASAHDIPWAEEYQTTHMVAEDYCFRMRQAGLQVWTVDALASHLSTGTIDQLYWDSVKKFRSRWKAMLPEGLPPVGYFRTAYEKKTAGKGWGGAWERSAHMRPPEARHGYV